MGHCSVVVTVLLVLLWRFVPATVAVFCTDVCKQLSPEGILSAMVTGRVLPAFKEPTLHATLPPCWKQLLSEALPLYVRPDGIGSVTVTFCALMVPLFETLMT